MSERRHAAKKSWSELAEGPAVRPAGDLARSLQGIILSATTLNQVIADDLEPVAVDSVRRALDGLLEAAEILSDILVKDLTEGAQEVVN